MVSQDTSHTLPRTVPRIDHSKIEFQGRGQVRQRRPRKHDAAHRRAFLVVAVEKFFSLSLSLAPASNSNDCLPPLSSSYLLRLLAGCVSLALGSGLSPARSPRFYVYEWNSFVKQRSRTPAHTVHSFSIYVALSERRRKRMATCLCMYVCTYLAYIYVHFTSAARFHRAHSNLFPWRNSRRVASLIAPLGRAVVQEQTPATTRWASRRRAAGTAGNSFSEFSNLDKLIQETLLVSGLV